MPAGIADFETFLVGGGAGGGMGGDTWEGGGGGGGGYTINNKWSYMANYTLHITIGAGGYNGYGNGGNTQCALKAPSGKSISICAYGGCIEGYRTVVAGYGGTGGGYGENLPYAYADSGYSDGSGNYEEKTYGNGQFSTTRAFGESDGTLYAGGGGGGKACSDTSSELDPSGVYYSNYAPGGAGGGGGGGYANYEYNIIESGFSGSTNTGGGGGGSAAYESGLDSSTMEMDSQDEDGNGKLLMNGGAIGGSGIAIIRWGY